MENIETLLAAVAQTQGFSDDEDDVSLGRKVGVEGSVSLPEIRRDSGASQLTDVPTAVGGCSEPATVVNHVPTLEIPVVPTNVVVIGAADKRKKRGRPPKGQLAERPPPPKRKKQEDEEEDVCFICFDGGSLVLCDRKGCPKAYHPACIKRDEAFFRSKAKWNCGWHICSTCQKPSHYMCYTCTYSLCKGCARDTDYLSVRGNKGFCTICLKTIMLIENKDQANEDAVQVDFDDKMSWEYLFKVYWTCLKDKLSLTLGELTQAKSPWNGAHAVASKPRLINAHHSAHGNAISYVSSVHSELRKPREEMSLLQNNQLSLVTSSIQNQVEKLNGDEGESVVGTGKLNVSKDTDMPGFDKNTDRPSTGVVSGSENAFDQVVMEKNENNRGIGGDIDNPDIGKEADKQRHKDTEIPEIVKNTEWASRELLEFVGRMKNGDISLLSQFDVQTLLLDYVKRNNLRDPCQKGQIICDHMLKNLFGKDRVGHIEMLQLLEYHFLTKEDCPSSFIPAGFVGSTASELEVDGNTYSSLITTNNKKRKTRKKSEDGAPLNKLNEYAAIDVHNINLICLRRNLLENLIEDRDNFHDKVVGSIVRIRISACDQKQDIYRLVQVVGTSKVAEPYKIGDKTTDIMLEVLNLNKKEVVSLDAISNAAVTEDECKRLRQSIRCGLVKQFTVGEVQKKSMELQQVRLNDLLEAEILRLNHLRDRASEKGHKKDLREYVHKLQLLKSPEERQRRIAEIPVVHDDPKMSPAYESEEDVRSADNSRKDADADELRPKSSKFTGNGRNPISPDKKGKREGSIQMQDKVIERVGANGSHSSDRRMNQVIVANSATIGMDVQAMLRSIGLDTSTASHSVGNSPPASNIETEKLWHYRDPNGKIQGPFAMLQLRKWNTTGLFPHDMRIWTNHEQYDSLLLTDALNRQFHGASDLPYNLSTESPDLGATGGDRVVNGTGSDSNQTGMALYDNSNVLSGNTIGSVRADASGTSHPQAWDFLKDNSSSADNVQVRSSHPSCAALPDRSQDPRNGENASSGLNKKQITSGLEFENQYNNRCQAGQSSEENTRTLPGDLSSMELESTSAPVSKSMESIKQDRSTNVPNLPCVAPKTIDKLGVVETAEVQQSVYLDVPMQNPSILELLSPTPRSNNEDQATGTKQYDFINFIVPNAGPSWSSSSGPVGGNLQLPEAPDNWCGYSPAAAKPSGQEWHSGLLSPSSLKPLEVKSDNVTATTSNNGQITHASPPNVPNWLAMFNEPIEFDALGEESVSDLLAEVDAMESQGGFPSPTSAMKFAKELIQDCKDDCFSSIEFSHLHDPGKNDALSSTGDRQLACQPSLPCKPAVESSFIDGLDSFRRSSVHSSASSEGETNAPVYPGEGGSEFHPPASVNTSQDMVGATMVLGTGSESNEPGWGTVQGNINLVTVQGNVNLVLGGPTQGMTNLSWGTNPGSGWGNPGVNLSPVNGNLPWDGQRMYSSPREWGYQGGEPGGFGRGRPQWGRQQYGGSSGGGGGYSRPPPKGQRVCKFYESGRCKKGAFCDYLHP
ncbi:zinc finger CCCH domain-containing protein 44-like isoform X1 [Primulina huaijiensis]|uniref:zinc finger CCCH domain-containing protein 44-like isoform X1 n=1 Tax=Primulina huaijiensis TaxID=1492673 RepID=UPI003CC6F644